MRQGSFVHGLTTAATLWFGTALGICFGGGQVALGAIVLALGLFVLDGLKWVEKRRKKDRHASLTITVDNDGPTEEEVASSLEEKGYEIGPWAFAYTRSGSQRELRVEVRWRALPQDVRPPQFLENLASKQGVIKLEWNP